MWNIMYVFAWESGHVVWREHWYALMSWVSLRANFYMIGEDHVFVTNMVVIDPTWEIVALGVISQPIGVVVKFNAIVKI
jgi:hypothetical protein